MGKRRKNKKDDIINANPSYISINKNNNDPSSNLNQDIKTHRLEIYKLSKNCSKEEFCLNFAKWMKSIFYIFQTEGQDLTNLLLQLLERASYCHGDICRQYFSDNANSIMNFTIGSSSSNPQLQLKILKLCLQFVPSVFGPYKNKIEAYLLNIENNLEASSVKILSECYSYLPLLGGSGTNNQNHVASCKAKLECHLFRLEHILTLDWTEMCKEEHAFRLHILSVINLFKMNLNFVFKIPIDRILEIIATCISLGENEQFKKIDVNVKTVYCLIVIDLLSFMITKFNDILWPKSEVIFKSLMKFLRFSKEHNLCELRCRVYEVTANCLLLNYCCKLHPVLTTFCESAIEDCSPQYLNHVEVNLPIIDNNSYKNKKRRHNANESLNMIGSSTANNKLPFQTGGHDWLDFKAIKSLCLAALSVLEAISSIHHFQIDAEKNEYKRNRIELITPIWRFAIETLVKLRTLNGVAHPYQYAECRKALYALLHQHISDDTFYGSRFSGQAYSVICAGFLDSDMKIRFLCRNILSTYNKHSTVDSFVSTNPTFNVLPKANIKLNQIPVTSGIFSSCRNSTLNDTQLSSTLDKSKDISTEEIEQNKELDISLIDNNSFEEMDESKNILDAEINPNNALDISPVNDNSMIEEKDISVNLSKSQYSISDSIRSSGHCLGNDDSSCFDTNQRYLGKDPNQRYHDDANQRTGGSQIENMDNCERLDEICANNIDRMGTIENSNFVVLDATDCIEKEVRVLNEGENRRIYNNGTNAENVMDKFDDVVDLDQKSKMDFMLATFVDADPD